MISLAVYDEELLKPLAPAMAEKIFQGKPGFVLPQPVEIKHPVGLSCQEYTPPFPGTLPGVKVPVLVIHPVFSDPLGKRIKPRRRFPRREAFAFARPLVLPGTLFVPSV
jgi:hypothetical protein